MPPKRDFYDILGIDKNSSPEEIKKAYRKKALECHPDRNKSPQATQQFKEVNEAYEVLSNVDKKSAYDQFGHAAFEQGGMGQGGFGGFGGQQGGAHTSRQGPFNYTYYTSGGGSAGSPFEDLGFDFSDPFEIFEQFFGGSSPFGRQRIPRYGLNLSFIEAAKGVEKEVEIGGKRRKIKIPAGVDEGTRINFQDFYITIDVHPDPVFKRDGQDVHVDVLIPFTLAILGGTITVPTIDGEVGLKIRPGTQPGTMVRLREKGIPYPDRNARGDEYVRLNVQIPQKLTQEQKKMVEQFEKSSEKKSGWGF
ncbi:MAG: DnaJ C-terminal domain-containing protein [bacterium]|nr:DnaJ C-terminal domain-containing protein [bacterium]